MHRNYHIARHGIGVPVMTPLFQPHPDLRQLRQKYGFAHLVRPRVGLIEVAQPLHQELGSPAFEVMAASLNNVAMSLPYVRRAKGDPRDQAIGGGGADTDAERAWIRAVVEGAERFSSLAHSPEDFVLARANELPNALDLGQLPKCSARELADPRCPLRLADKNSAIRWAKAISLLTGNEVWVPALLSHLYLEPLEAERFWLPISTGVAAHTSLGAALVSAICEVVERDAIAMTWLMRLPLPRIIDPAPPSAEVRDFLARLHNSQVRQTFFDATTDVGVPTVFSVQLTEGHPTCSVFVSAAAAPDPYTAYAKAIREAAPARSVMSAPREVPSDVADFFDLTHGASYYGRGGHNHDFDFLFNSSRQSTLAEMTTRSTIPPIATERAQLRALLRRFCDMGMDVLALDITSAEVRDAGLWVVRVVIPQLVPVSFVHRARFLGTPRLYDYPRRAGFGGRTEDDVNYGPMPFA